MAWGSGGANQWITGTDHPSKRTSPQYIISLRIGLTLNIFFLFSRAMCHVDCLQVPEKYFAHMIHRLGNPMLDSVRDAPHLRQPIFKRKARRFSYKMFNEGTFKRVLGDQDMLQTATKCQTCPRCQQKRHWLMQGGEPESRAQDRQAVRS